MKKRINRCIRAFEKEKCDGFLASNQDTIRYLTGFRDAEGYLVISSKRKPVYITSPIYAQEAAGIALWDVKVSRYNTFELICSVIRSSRLKRVGFEGKHLSFMEHQRINKLLLDTNTELKPLDRVTETLRMIKDTVEIALIRKAAAITHEAFEFTREFFNPSLTEKDVALELSRFIKIKADNLPAFEPIVAFNAHASLPHHESGAQKIGPNGMSLIDLGARYYGYCADLTRVFFWGKISPTLQKIHSVVKTAQARAIKKIKDGVQASDVDREARKYITSKGFGKYFTHGLGHGVGLCVHEEPYLNPVNDDVLKEGMVITVEPGVYLPGRYGIRIEDMILVGSKRGEIIRGHTDRES